MTPSHLLILRPLATLAFALFAWSAFAQPSAEQMIEQLKAAPPAEAAKPGLTRGLRRNLVVEAADVVAAPEPAATAIPAAPRPALSLNIQFDLNSAQVQAVSQQALRNLAQALQSPALLSAHFAIEGHTDAKGRADYNQKLSQQRAQAVRDFLAQLGVDGARLQASGKGSSELANPQDPFAAENRRVRIVNLL
jgi:outer membrane protein OmpA-like peptidoglycan-associated protein